MTPAPVPATVPAELADLRSVPLGDLPSLPPLTLDAAVQRVLPAAPGPAQGAAFSSAIQAPGLASPSVFVYALRVTPRDGAR